MIMGIDIEGFCLDCLNGNRDLSEVNHTYIALIPKVKDPKHISQFRLISLCNVLYKVVTRTIVNRMKHVLPV